MTTSVVTNHSSAVTSDWLSMPGGYSPGNVWSAPDHLWQQSLLRYAAAIHTPLMLVHSERDLRCSVSQAEELYMALKLLKREVVLVRCSRETNHGLSRSGPLDLRMVRLQRYVDWLTRHF